MRKMRNWAQLIFVARKMRKFAPTRKPVALETLPYSLSTDLDQLKDNMLTELYKRKLLPISLPALLLCFDKYLSLSFSYKYFPPNSIFYLFQPICDIQHRPKEITCGTTYKLKVHFMWWKLNWTYFFSRHFAYIHLCALWTPLLITKKCPMGPIQNYSLYITDRELRGCLKIIQTAENNIR